MATHTSFCNFLMSLNDIETRRFSVLDVLAQEIMQKSQGGDSCAQEGETLLLCLWSIVSNEV